VKIASKLRKNTINNADRGQVGYTEVHHRTCRNTPRMAHGCHNTLQFWHEQTGVLCLSSPVHRVLSLCLRNPRPAARHPVAALQTGNSTVSQTAPRDPTGQGTIGKSELHSTPRVRQNIRTKTRISAGDRFPNTLAHVFVHQQHPLGSGLGGHRPGLDMKAERKITSHKEWSPEHPAHTQSLT